MTCVVTQTNREQISRLANMLFMTEYGCQLYNQPGYYGNRNPTMDSMTIPMSDHNAWATAMSNLGMAPINMTGQQLMPEVLK
ncbi:hypothetical protein PAMP_023167 [Pampus punctatissimus]